MGCKVSYVMIILCTINTETFKQHHLEMRDLMVNKQAHNCNIKSKMKVRRS